MEPETVAQPAPTTQSSLAVATTPVEQAAANAMAASAAGAAGAVRTAEQIAADAAALVPQPVSYTLALPKDAVMEASAIERLTAFAKAHTLSPETAQHALDHVNAEVAADRAQQNEANRASFETLARETWPNAIKADKEFGGEQFDVTVAESKRAADRFVTPEEKEILNTTGWGNHPLLVKIMARVGRALSNDKLVLGGQGGGERDTTLEGRAARMYPNPAK